jgi:hypothetical protein
MPGPNAINPHKRLEASESPTIKPIGTMDQERNYFREHNLSQPTFPDREIIHTQKTLSPRNTDAVSAV